MPADGEFQFWQLIAQYIKSEYAASKQSECFRSALANCAMITGASYLAAYVGLRNPKKAFSVALPVGALSAIATAVICNTNKET